MSRELSPAQEFAFGNFATAPRYLVRIDLDGPYHYATADTVEWSGQTWIPSQIKMGTVANDTAQLWIENDGHRHSLNAVSGVYMRKPVQIWSAYNTPVVPYAEEGYWDEDYAETSELTTPILLFDGIVSSARPVENEWLQITATRLPPKFFPSERWRAPLANHLPAVGQVIEFGTAIITFEAVE